MVLGSSTAAVVRYLFLAVVFLYALSGQPLRAQGTPEGQGAPQDQGVPEEARQGLGPFSAFWVRAGLGGFNNEPEPQLPGQRDLSSMIVSAGVEFASAPYLTLEFEVVSTSRSFDTEGGAFIIVVDDETSVQSEAYTLGSRLTLPWGSPVRAYGTAGLAVIHTRFKTDASLFGLPGTAREESDTSFRPVVGGGLQVLLGQWGLHVDYRRLTVGGSFPEYEIEDIALGGSVVTFGASYRLDLTTGS